MTAVSRLAAIKWQLATNRPVAYDDIMWLVAQLEGTEEWRRREIEHANRAYLLAHWNTQLLDHTETP